jgi:hypothetical protein
MHPKALFMEISSADTDLGSSAAAEESSYSEEAMDVADKSGSSGRH